MENRQPGETIISNNNNNNNNNTTNSNNNTNNTNNINNNIANKAKMLKSTVRRKGSASSDTGGKLPNGQGTLD